MTDLEEKLAGPYGHSERRRALATLEALHQALIRALHAGGTKAEAACWTALLASVQAACSVLTHFDAGRSHPSGAPRPAGMHAPHTTTPQPFEASAQ